MLDAATCRPPGAGGHSASELRRQAVLADDLRQRLDDVARALPRTDAHAGWWGPARDALQAAIDIERARLAREAERLEGVRIRLFVAAEQAESLPPGGLP